jgi:hypothetical protein
MNMIKVLGIQFASLFFALRSFEGVLERRTEEFAVSGISPS